MRVLAIPMLAMVLTGCGGLAYDTRVAHTMVTRLAMLDSISIGDTTETQFVTRWGNPLQKVRDGGRVEYIYRSLNGDPTAFVIVTFEYGVAIAARSTETEGCRASFAPRIPGYAGDTADIVKPIGWCENAVDPYVPQGFWQRAGDEVATVFEDVSGAISGPWAVVEDDTYTNGPQI